MFKKKKKIKLITLEVSQLLTGNLERFIQFTREKLKTTYQL